MFEPDPRLGDEISMFLRSKDLSVTVRGAAVALTTVDLPLTAACLELATFLELDERLIDLLDAERFREELDDDRSREFLDEVRLIVPLDVDEADPLNCAAEPPGQFGAYFVQIS